MPNKGRQAPTKIPAHTEGRAGLLSKEELMRRYQERYRRMRRKAVVAARIAVEEGTRLSELDK